MKTNLSKQQKKGITLLFIFLTIMLGIYAQKSIIQHSENVSLSGLRVIVAEIKHPEGIMPDCSLEPIEFKFTLNSSGMLNLENPEFTDFDLNTAPEEEETLKIEDWMLDENHFMPAFSEKLLEDVEDEKLEIEDWMLDESHFLKNRVNQEDNSDLKEESLEIEDWMLDESHFFEKTGVLNPDKQTAENEITIETWMLNPVNWSSGNN